MTIAENPESVAIIQQLETWAQGTNEQTELVNALLSASDVITRFRNLKDVQQADLDVQMKV